MNPLYNTGLRLYRLGAKVAAMRSPKVRKMVAGQEAAFDYLSERITPDDKWIWIHAASLGEFEQGRPLIEMIKERRPSTKILLTFFSPSGYEVRKDYQLADAVCYLPFDTPSLAKRFLDIVNPSMAVFIKYEFWGNYLAQLKSRAVPTYLVSAIFRPDQSFFRWWGGWFRQMLNCFTKVYVQDSRSIELLAGIGVTNVTKTGDTRFDRVSDVRNHPLKVPEIAGFGGGYLRLVVGSSWEADEDIYIPWLNAHPEVKAIIAPHEFDDDRLSALIGRVDGKAVLLSQWREMVESGADDLDRVRAVIVDSFGQLSSLYRLADVAYIGGGFGKSIHNINEAAVYGIPVIFGPRHGKFKEAGDLLACGGAFSAADAAGIRAALDSLATDKSLRLRSGKAAEAYIDSHLGATSTIYQDLFPSK